MSLLASLDRALALHLPGNLLRNLYPRGMRWFAEHELFRAEPKVTTRHGFKIRVNRIDAINMVSPLFQGLRTDDIGDVGARPAVRQSAGRCALSVRDPRGAVSMSRASIGRHVVRVASRRTGSALTLPCTTASFPSTHVARKLAVLLALATAVGCPLSAASAQSERNTPAEAEAPSPARIRVGQRLGGPAARKLDSRLETRLDTRLNRRLGQAVNREDEGRRRGDDRTSRRCGIAC
jgi:hypothetical protein